MESSLEGNEELIKLMMKLERNTVMDEVLEAIGILMCLVMLFSWIGS